MSEQTAREVEVRRPARARLLVGVVLAGLALAACQTDSGSMPRVEASAVTTTAPSVSVESRTVTILPPPEKITPATPTTATVPTSETVPHHSGLAGCAPYLDIAKYTNHEYEVCTAYIANAAEVALQGMYKFGNNSVSYLAAGARHHFETRYWSAPRTAIEQEVSTWPTTSKLKGNKVEQAITLQDLSSDLSADRGLITTLERWRVTAPDGTILLDEPTQLREATMCRGQLPGHPLHEWVVVSNSIEPNLDCIAFDKANGLTP